MTEATSMADSGPMEYAEAKESITTPHDDLELGDRKTLRRLASLGKFNSQQSQQGTSTLDRYATLEGTSPGDDIFNPESDRFDLYKWIRLNMKMVTEEGIKPKRTGFAFRNLSVRGTGPALNIQSTVGSLLMTPMRIGEILRSRQRSARHILKDFNGLVRSGELLVVLGRPGSGCSTLLKTLTGEMHGLQVDADAVVHYNGIEQAQMMKEFKGEVIYNAENDKHFPHLTVR